ncbi:MAG: hypothetical protein B6I34_11085 [Anaerolineaceae bacterium 4572_32.1]|nr:MAG: hypothetical protein B6I34_11085 [Anaerolineaceae bacterium 4572_32.1]
MSTQKYIQNYLNLNQAVVEMLKMLRRVMGEHIDLDFRPHPDLRTVRADPSQIGQILTNLCVNARDALSEGGKIIITTEEAEVDETYCKTYPFAKPGTFIVLSVSDNGCGMDPTTLEQVFEPFFTTKEVGEGSGLGLSTVYGLVKQHDGFVQVLSEVDQGSTFKVFLPLAEDGIDKVRDPQTEPILSGTETILLAEDDEMVRMLTTTMLERNGYSVLVSENGEDAISVFDQHAHEIDMVLLDVLMPKLGGRAVFDHVRKTHPHMPALFTSGYNMDAIHTNFVLDEGLALIQKPAKREEMLSKVREVLNRKNSR